MSAPLLLANDPARRLLLTRTGLLRPAAAPRPALLARIVELGYVQLDSIRTVERAHHHILFTRDSSYRPNQLEALQHGAPLLFEHWTHDAALIPLAFYPHWHMRFAQARARRAQWLERIGDARVVAHVRAHIARQGPSLAREFTHLGGRTGPWWGWGPAKAALEFLWRSGELAVLRRRGFEKIYELAEHAIPATLRQQRPSREQSLAWALDAALNRLGVATARMLADFWGHADGAEVQAFLRAEMATGRLIKVQLQSAAGQPPISGFARPQLEQEISRLPLPRQSLRILSPFDPLLRDRSRLARLFGFEYRIEVFVPKARRRHGYYVFPVLEGSRLIGRIDMKAERARDALVVHKLWLEPQIALGAGRRARLENDLIRQARLAGVRDIVFPLTAVKTR